MIMDWTIGLDEQTTESIDKLVKSNTMLLGRLADICEKKIKDSSVSSVDDYESPSWAYRAADKEGYNRALRYIISLTKAERKL